jgi:hypothetical protein
MTFGEKITPTQIVVFNGWLFSGADFFTHTIGFLSPRKKFFSDWQAKETLNLFFSALLVNKIEIKMMCSAKKKTIYIKDKNNKKKESKN